MNRRFGKPAGGLLPCHEAKVTEHKEAHRKNRTM